MWRKILVKGGPQARTNVQTWGLLNIQTEQITFSFQKVILLYNMLKLIVNRFLIKTLIMPKNRRMSTFLRRVGNANFIYKCREF